MPLQPVRHQGVRFDGGMYHDDIRLQASQV
jgi:hypothetical protein